MWLRLRQIALVAERLAPVEQALIDVLGVKVCFRDPGVGHFGLENALFPVGNQFLEVVAPIRENTAGGRYLERRGGDGGYMVITQCDDHAPRRQRVEALGVRIVNQFATHEFRNMQLHPKDTGGSFFEIDEQFGPGAHAADGPWEPAGPDWKAGQSLQRVRGIAAAEVQCDDPEAVAARWSEIAQIPLTRAESHPCLPLDNASVRFVPCRDGRPEGLGGIDVIAVDSAAILAAAEARRVRSGDAQIHLCGMRINLV
ncbi:MAG: VOC family protein [Pseudomonadales bacterium]